MRNSSKKGFTYVELLMSLSITAMFLTSVMSSWYFSTKSFKQENLKGQLRFELSKALEWMKEDVRKTDGSKILFYPSDDTTYTAISLPLATTNGSGLYTLSSSMVSWDKTVIYHIYDNAGTVELRRTVFSSFDSTAATRQSQLDSVVTSGGNDSATTRVLAEGDSIELSIIPTSPSFDGYSSALELGENTSFGTMQLSSGNHTARFTITGKNAASSGYKMGFDQLAFTPSGSGQEAEVLTISGSSGGGSSIENMTSFGDNGLWHGNHQLEYNSSGVGNYVEFQIYYDRWLESNFSDMTHSSTEVTGDDPVVRVSSRENQSLISSWRATNQTTADETDNTGFHNKTIRNIVDADSIETSGEMVRFKFKASAATGELVIHEAHFGVRDTINPFDFAAAPSQLYFGNATIGSGDADGTGATGATGGTSITIPQGHYVWSNWMIQTVATGGITDYLMSIVVDSNNGSGNETMWDAGSGVASYVMDGASAPTGSWAAETYAPDSAIHALSDMAAWTSTGTVTSQIYDSHMTSPSLATLTWSTNGSGAYTFKVRSSANEDMSGAPAWAAVSDAASSPAALSSGSRYIQWQATMTASSPYSTYPEIDDVGITWPGQTAIVDVSGYLTKRPNYGTFSVAVDGQSLVNALQVELSNTNEFQGVDYNTSLSVEMKARNTGK